MSSAGGEGGEVQLTNNSTVKISEGVEIHQ
jgi:hypothetical protein